jgi:hypothetical protein
MCLRNIYQHYIQGYIVRVRVFNATFNNISVISWRSVLLVKEPDVTGMVCSLPIDESHPLLGHHQVDLQMEMDGADLLETPRLFSG